MKILSVGKSNICNITLPTNSETVSVSRYHMDIIPSKMSVLYLIVDRNSTNGTFVNGQKIRQKEVSESDEIRLGLYSVTLRELFSTFGIKCYGETQYIKGDASYVPMKTKLRNEKGIPYRDPESGEIILWMGKKNHKEF